MASGLQHEEKDLKAKVTLSMILRDELINNHRVPDRLGGTEKPDKKNAIR